MIPPAHPRLAGCRALVTGASRGIGRAVAERFAAEGAIVAVNHLNDEAAAAETLARLGEISAGAGFGGAAHLAAPGDVADPEALAGLFASAIGTLGGLDIMVNNAGIQALTPGDAFDAALFARIIGVNLAAVAHGSSLAIRHFLSRPSSATRGVIINTSSVHEVIPKPGYLAYSASKGGIGNITRTLALEFAGRGIRVNAVAPGATLTDMNADWANDAARRRDVERHIPMGRAAEPEEMAAIFAFLASDDASYVTGQTIQACGGLSLYADFASNWSS
ncbi:MAG TPA: SDR family oxidoreductase [Acetobacteraceae bacterium]|nr:SDR family oxidoreductase [Acetobacteraceae bacterium]